jgi:outer membrane protein assembly factor BamB
VWEYLEGQNARGLSAITQAGELLTYGNGSAKVDVVSLLTARPREPLHINGGDTYQSTAAYDGELVYSAEGKGVGAYRLKTEANPEKRLSDAIFQYKEPHWDKYHPHFSAVGLDDKHVYAGNLDTYLYAVDKQTGKLAWKFKTGDAVYSAPSIAKGIVYFGSMDGSLYAVDAQSGQEKWAFKTGGPIVWSSPWIGDGVIYIGSHDGKVYAIK